MKELFDYYSKLSGWLALQLSKELQDRSTIIATSRRSESWYPYLNWRNITDREFLNLALACASFPNYTAWSGWKITTEAYLLEEIKSTLIQVAKRFKGSKIQKIVEAVEKGRWALLLNMDLHLWLPPREFAGNLSMESTFRDWIKGNFTIRYHTQRRLRKQERIRGYRDHGSMSSVSEKARKRANRVSIAGVDQEGHIVDYFAKRDSIEFRKQQIETRRDPKNLPNRQNE